MVPTQLSWGCRWETAAEPSKPRWRKGWGWLLPRPMPESAAVPLAPSHPRLSPPAQGSLVNSSGEMLKMSAPLEHLNLHIREGAILPTQVSAHPSPPRGLSTACVPPPAPQLPDPHPGCLQPYSTHVFEPQKPGTTSEVTRGNALRLIVALSSSATAWGDLFWDDGESLDTFERGSYSYLVFNVTQVGHGREGRGGVSCGTWSS